MMALQELNALPRDQAVLEFEKCCGARAWCEAMEAARPFSSLEELKLSASKIWFGLSEREWRKAFDHHPRIGAKKASGWAGEEQSGVNEAATQVLERLAEGNTRYEERFGHIYLVCATGKSAQEMLAILESRLENAPDEEMRIAAGEQDKITRIRLEKMIS